MVFPGTDVGSLARDDSVDVGDRWPVGDWVVVGPFPGTKVALGAAGSIGSDLHRIDRVLPEVSVADDDLVYDRSGRNEVVHAGVLVVAKLLPHSDCGCRKRGADQFDW